LSAEVSYLGGTDGEGEGERKDSGGREGCSPCKKKKTSRKRRLIESTNEPARGVEMVGLFGERYNRPTCEGWFCAGVKTITIGDTRDRDKTSSGWQKKSLMARGCHKVWGRQRKKTFYPRRDRVKLERNRAQEAVTAKDAPSVKEESFKPRIRKSAGRRKRKTEGTGWHFA